MVQSQLLLVFKQLIIQVDFFKYYFIENHAPPSDIKSEPLIP